MEAKKSFILYTDLVYTVEKLSDDIAGKLLKIILDYVNGKSPNTSSMDLVLQVAFEPIRQQLNRDLEHWNQVRQSRSNNGKKGGRPKKQTEAKKTNALSGKQTKAKKAVNGNVNDSVNDISEVFEEFRKTYPGTKRGLNAELANFLKKYEPEIVHKLMPGLLKEIEWRKEARQPEHFVPPWKHLSTWINKMCWEQVLPTINSVNGHSTKGFEKPKGLTK